MIDDFYKLKNGDIIFARTGASTGKSYLYIPEDGEIYFAGFLIRFRIILANPKFIFYSTLTSRFQKWVRIASMRSGQPGINAKEYASFKIFLPHPNEQQKIANTLSSVDAKISALRRKRDLLKEYKRGLTQKLFDQTLRFTDKNGQPFPSWEEKQLREVAIINPASEPLPDSFIYINLESVVKGVLISKMSEKKETAPSRAQRVLKQGDVLFQMVRPYQKNNLFFNFEGSFVASTGYAQLRSKTCKSFLFHLIHTTVFVNKVLARCTGTSYPAINSNDLATIQINIPYPDEQQKMAISESLHRKMGVFLGK